MARVAKKKPVLELIEFSRARDIPFNRIRLSHDNVRETDVEAGLDDLAYDVERREDLIQGINVRAILDADGNETGDFETPAGGRRFRVIARLVERGRFPADGLVPCIVKKANAKTSAIDDSLAENTFRLALHPLDQFKAFKRMVDGGMTKAEVASAYFTTERYVDQRLALAKVSPALHEVYAENGMTLAMLEAFTAHPDHARQEQVWDAVRQSHYREPWRIRNMLTETSVPASDKRARINLGIRRRLATLVGNDQDQIRLLHAMLLALPGSPVLYYGDEIGMLGPRLARVGDLLGERPITPDTVARQVAAQIGARGEHGLETAGLGDVEHRAGLGVALREQQEVPGPVLRQRDEVALREAGRPAGGRGAPAVAAGGAEFGGGGDDGGRRRCGRGRGGDDGPTGKGVAHGAFSLS